MNLERAQERAQAVTTIHQAARLYNELNHELEYGNYTFEQAAPGEDALHQLERRFPGVADVAGEVTDPPSLSRRANTNLRARGETPRPRQSGQRPRQRGGSGGAGRGRSSSSPRRPRARSSYRGGSPGRVAARATGVSGGSVADTTIGVLRWLLVGGLAYQVLQPRGANAFAGILNGVGRGVSLVVDPVDPLGGRSSSSAQAAASGPPAPVLTTTTAPAASVSAPGTAAHPNMMQAPFSTFPRVPTPFPLVNVPGVTPRRPAPRLATGPNNRMPASPLTIGRNPLTIGG